MSVEQLRRNAAEQIVGRERDQRTAHRQLACNAVACRRVNSNVMPLAITLGDVAAIAGLIFGLSGFVRVAVSN